ncbi:MAG: hypothetical protein ACD_46C00718G0001 [uncultured bacterium]|nr:MAG: hypothetical protein ACD_46C00718G0001 [uncultured bacterium]
MLIAHTFGHAQYTQQKLNARYTVYIVSAAGTLGPSEKIDVCNESEHSVPGGIDYQDIASYRECFFNTANPSKITCESIFVANKFEKKHPHLVPPILKALRFPSEQTSRQESEEKKRSSFK